MPQVAAGTRDLGRNFQLSYGDGSMVGGTTYEADVRLGNIVANELTVGAAELPKCHGQLAGRYELDGIFGLGIDDGISGKALSLAFDKPRFKY